MPLGVFAFHRRTSLFRRCSRRRLAVDRAFSPFRLTRCPSAFLKRPGEMLIAGPLKKENREAYPGTCQPRESVLHR